MGSATTGLLVAAAALGGSGAVLLARGRLRCTALLALAAAVALVASATAAVLGAPALRDALAVLATLGLTTFAVATYPVTSWRHPFELVCGAALAGSAVTAAAAPTDDVVGTMTVVTALGLVVLGWWRVEHARDDAERALLLWAALVVGGVTLVAGTVSFALESRGTEVIVASSFVVAAVLLVRGGLRPVDDVRALVAPVVVVVLAAIGYIAVLVTLLEVLDRAGAGLTAGGEAVLAFALALGVAPARARLRGTVDELLFGGRPDPWAAATRASGVIGALEDPADALAEVRAALVLPHLALEVDGIVVAEAGEPPARVQPVAVPGEPAARLLVGVRVGDLALSADDVAVLGVVGPLLGLTLRAQRLAAEVQRSRGRAVAAIEEERRRLRRDLHDGLGPTLSGLAFTADAARNTLRSAPAEAESLLTALRADATDAVAEVRRLVYGMRPPALDELGLAGALAHWAASLHAASGERMAVAVDLPSDPADLAGLSAAVETAAYRIAVEALTNAARHSGASEASLCLEVGGEVLVVEVADPGPASPEGPAGPRAWTPGVGLSSMRERAAEVGGTLVTGSGRVRAELPL